MFLIMRCDIVSPIYETLNALNSNPKEIIKSVHGDVNDIVDIAWLKLHAEASETKI